MGGRSFADREPSSCCELCSETDGTGRDRKWIRRNAPYGSSGKTSRDLLHGARQYSPHEGVLLPSSTFRLYLYDEYTKPLSTERVRKTKAYLTVVGADPFAARKVELMSNGDTLEASLGKDLRLPAVLKLTVFFGDLPSNGKEEEFSFHFRQYSAAQSGERISHDGHDSDGMSMNHPM
jgi:hypothetical protein